MQACGLASRSLNAIPAHGTELVAVAVKRIPKAFDASCPRINGLTNDEEKDVLLGIKCKQAGSMVEANNKL